MRPDAYLFQGHESPCGLFKSALILYGIMIYVYISVPVIVYSFMFLVRFPRCVHENFIKTVSSLHPDGAWLDVQRYSSLHFFSDGEFAYFYNDCLYFLHYCMNHEPEKILKFYSKYAQIRRVPDY